MERTVASRPSFLFCGEETALAMRTQAWTQQWQQDGRELGSSDPLAAAPCPDKMIKTKNSDGSVSIWGGSRPQKFELILELPLQGQITRRAGIVLETQKNVFLGKSRPLCCSVPLPVSS
jgi:hypothetical protein